MSLTKGDVFAGRKLRKDMDKSAKMKAKALVSGDPENIDLLDARAMFSYHYALREKNLDALIIKKGFLTGYQVVLTFDRLRRGVPNVLGAPGKPKSEDEAMFEAERLLVAAWVKILDTKAMMNCGQMDDLRLFNYQGLMLEVPGEWVDKAALKIPADMPESDRKKIRSDHIKRLRTTLGSTPLTPDAWSSLEEDNQIQAMISAATLLCVEINQAA